MNTTTTSIATKITNLIINLIVSSLGVLAFSGIIFMLYGMIFHGVVADFGPMG
jgi:hypothetical protein